MKTTFIFSILLVSLFFNSFYSQDKIILKTKDTLEVKVISITENLIVFKKSNYLDGPNYELKNVMIDKIIFFDGKVENFDIYNICYTGQKNAVEIIFSEMSMSRIGLAYSRQLGNYFKVRAQGGYSIGNDYIFDPNHEIKNYINFQALYYPNSHKKVAYYTGLDYRFGNFENYYHYYYFNYQKSLENFSRYGLVNGLEINFSKHFSVNTYFTTGILQEVNSKDVNAKIDGGISICTKF
jgi:hypothetical protein